MKNYTEILEPDSYYHVYNHAVGKDVLFKKDENYYFFLTKFSEYILPIADIFAYCLMPNHFHLAIRIHSTEKLSEIRTLQKFQTLTMLSNENFVSKQFSNFFSSYTQAYNKQQDRKGNLFEKPFRRKKINDTNYFKQIIHYIHFNPVHHGFVSDLRDWKFTSFESFFSEKSTKLKRDEVIEMFDNKENFFFFHKKEIDEKMKLELEI